MRFPPPTSPLSKKFERRHCFSKPNFPRAVGEVGRAGLRVHLDPPRVRGDVSWAVYNLHFSFKLGAALKRLESSTAGWPAARQALRSTFENKTTDLVDCKSSYRRLPPGQRRERRTRPNLLRFAPCLRPQLRQVVPCPMGFKDLQPRWERRQGPRGET